MSDAAQTAPIDARQASMSRVQTLDSVLASAAPADPPKSDPTTDVEAPAVKPEDGSKSKQSAKERIAEVIEQRKAAEAKAADAEQRANDLAAQLEALKVKADPIAPTDRPQRSLFASQDEYDEALTDWKADQRIAAREAQQAEAQAKADMAAVETAYSARVEAAKQEIEDFVEVIEASDMQISDVAAMAIKRSKEGPLLLYFLAQHPDELKKLNRMHPIDVVGHLKDLGRELVPEAKTTTKTVERSKAPEPIAPVRQSQALNQGSASSFEEHRARRRAEQAGKK